MIFLFTDYGLDGPYIGQVETVIAGNSPQEKIINLMADAPRNNPKASSYLLASLIKHVPKNSIVFAVVDPGVGTQKDKPIVVQAHDCWFVGPDNGLFDLIIRMEQDVKCWEITSNKKNISNSFHGRDIYAPECAYIAKHGSSSGDRFNWQDKRYFPDNLYEVIYVDHFGNCMTGIQESAVESDRKIFINGHEIAYASTFGKVESGQAFWYINSNKLLEISVNQGDASKVLSIDIGTTIDIC